LGKSEEEEGRKRREESEGKRMDWFLMGKLGIRWKCEIGAGKNG
jgi:hypothetical protein